MIEECDNLRSSPLAEICPSSENMTNLLAPRDNIECTAFETMGVAAGAAVTTFIESTESTLTTETRV